MKMRPTQDTRTLHDLVSREVSSPPSTLTKKEIERLLAQDATLNFPSIKEGYPHYPLAVAIRECQPEWVRYLLNLGASPMLDPPSVSGDLDACLPSFHPLGVSLDVLCMEILVSRQEWITDPDNPDIQILRMILDHGPDVLEHDPWRKNAFEPACEMPLLRWADHLVGLKEEMDSGRLSPQQVKIATIVVDALLARAPGWFQDQVKNALQEGEMVLNPNMDQDARRFCEKIAGCPEVVRAWWSEAVAGRMEVALPPAGHTPSFSAGPARL